MADTTTAVMAPPSGPTTPPPGSPACKQFPFRLLPVEIRLMIYDLVFISPNPIRIDDPRLRHRPAVRHRRGASPDPVASLHPHGYHGYHDPAYRDLRGSDDTLPRGTMEMLLLSKAISAEIRYALYTKNTIEVSTKYHRAWFCTIGRPGPRPSNPTFAGQRTLFLRSSLPRCSCFAGADKIGRKTDQHSGSGGPGRGRSASRMESKVHDLVGAG